jgi:PAS domain S-box-containing protein
MYLTLFSVPLAGTLGLTMLTALAEIVLVLLAVGLAVWLRAEVMRYRRVRRELAQSRRETEGERERFAKVAETITEGLMIHRGGVPVEVNPALERILGYSASEMVGRPVLDFAVDGESRAEIARRMRAADERPYEITGLHKSGRRLPLVIEARELTDGLRAVLVLDMSVSLEREREAVERQRRMRALYDLTAGSVDAPVHVRIGQALGYACDLLGLEMGLVSHVSGDAFEVVAAHSSTGEPAPGTVFRLGQTYCSILLEGEQQVLSDSSTPGTRSWRGRPLRPGPARVRRRPGRVRLRAAPRCAR